MDILTTLARKKEYDFDVIDCKLVSMPPEVTIQQVFEMLKLSKVKFYLCMRQKENTDSKSDDPETKTSSSASAPSQTSTNEEQEDDDFSDLNFTSSSRPASSFLR
ncbi:hypothetical protein BaRGS_00018785 [Batillaria attramentaria]|uniref:Uncharacterized protein n=1 Tax=Batillaria attramentaria TaxID=370345 RepID=A0ABD0KS05_9CAEN